MRVPDQVTEDRRKGVKLALIHQLISELYSEIPDSSTKTSVKDAGLTISDAICHDATRQDLLMDLDTFDRLRESDVLESDEYEALMELCLQTMYPDEAAD